MSYKMNPDPPLTNGNLRDKIENFKDIVIHPITGNYRMDKIPYVGIGGFKKAGDRMTKKLKESSARIKSSTERLKSAKAKYKAAKAKVNKK